MLSDTLANKLAELLYKEVDPSDEIPNASPLLAHYTSLQNLENIVRNREVWLSSPLYMNDHEEVRFGVNASVEIVLKSEEIKTALRTDERRKSFYDAFIRYDNAYRNDEVLDLYVMCFSLHSTSETDGKLSMWRGYGQNGKGCALIFDTAKLCATEDGPLVIPPKINGVQK